MTKRVEVRATINHAGLSVGAKALVDPESPYIAMCLDAGHLVRTGREVVVPSPVATGAVRPSAVAATAAVKPAAPKRKRKSRAKPPATTDAAPRNAHPS